MSAECLMVGALAGAMLSYVVSVAALYAGGTRHRAMPRISAGAVAVAMGLLSALAVVAG